MNIPDDINFGVSRETFEKLEVYVSLLEKWNKAINLVSKTTMEHVWHRHIRDSLQIAELADFPCQWLDLGSGGGLPGLIIAAKVSVTSPETHITLVESDQRKCAFIATAADAMSLDVTIHCRRIEESTGQTYDVISARALASLPDLMELALPYRHERTVCIFPKGARAQQELEEAKAAWRMEYQMIDSVTDPSASIIRLQEYSRVSNQ